MGGRGQFCSQAGSGRGWSLDLAVREILTPVPGLCSPNLGQSDLHLLFWALNQHFAKSNKSPHS